MTVIGYILIGAGIPFVIKGSIGIVQAWRSNKPVEIRKPQGRYFAAECLGEIGFFVYDRETNSAVSDLLSDEWLAKREAERWNEAWTEDVRRFKELCNLMPSSSPEQAVAHEHRYGEEYRALKKRLGADR